MPMAGMAERQPVRHSRSYMETIMKISAVAVALVMGFGFVAEAQAWPMAMGGRERPPPNGANGASDNGFNSRGISSDAIAVKAAILKDGSRVVLK